MISYKSNTDAILGKIRNMLKPDKMDEMYLEIAQALYASNLRRVHNEGKAVSGNIGTYSKKGLYVSPKGLRKFPLKGKNGQTKFLNGKPHKTGYFSSYGNFKNAIGYGRRVNMQVTGRLRADWVLLRSSNGYMIGFRSAYGKNVSIGNENRFKKQIWGVTAADKKTVQQIVKRYLAKS